MLKYRDIYEYHDKCYYCVCKECDKDNCKLVKCEFCEGGPTNSIKKCTYKDKNNKLQK